MREGVSKGYGQEDILRTVETLRANGIYIIANYIFGLPDDTMETMQETLDLALELNCEFANFYCTMAYPGSELYKDAIRESWDLPETWMRAINDPAKKVATKVVRPEEVGARIPHAPIRRAKLLFEPQFLWIVRGKQGCCNAANH